MQLLVLFLFLHYNEVVLNTNKKCIEYATDGMSWKELNDYAKKIERSSCY